MVKDERIIFLVQVLIKPDARRGSREHTFQRRLAHRKRIAPQIVPVELDQIEGPHEHVCIMPPVSDTIEAGYAIAPARHSFPVNNAGPQAQTTERLDNERKTVSQIIPGPAVEPHAFAFLTSDDPEAVPFNFSQPNRTGRRIRGTGRKARRNEARRQCTRTQLRHARLDRKAWGRSRVDAALLPVGRRDTAESRSAPRVTAVTSSSIRDGVRCVLGRALRRFGCHGRGPQLLRD